MAAPERDNVAPLGEKVLSALDIIEQDARSKEVVLALGDGLKLRPDVIS